MPQFWVMFDALKKWLNARGDYKEGVAIYRQLGSDNDLLRYLEISTNTASSYNRLFAALRAIYYTLKGVPVPVSPLLEPTEDPIKPSNQIAVTGNDSSGDGASAVASDGSGSVVTAVAAVTPVVLNPRLEAAAADAANRLYKELMNERARLFYNCKIDAERYENNDDQVAIRKQYVLKILELQPKVHNAYATLRYVKQHGLMPEASESPPNESFTIPDNPIELEKFRVNLLKRIARQKKLEQTPERVAYLQSLEQLKIDVYNAIGKYQ